MIESKVVPIEQTREQVEQELQKTRHSSLIAARRGDYDQVAQLTLKLIRLSKLVPESRFDRSGQNLALPCSPPRN